MATKLEEVLFEVNCAVFRAIDETLNDQLGMTRKTWIMDKHLPNLIPAIEAATKAAMREVYDLMPESLDVSPEFIAKTKAQLAAARSR
jgi:hypothetical protein